MDSKIEKVNFLGRYLASSRSEKEILDMGIIISHDILGFDHAMIRLLEDGVLKSVRWKDFQERRPTWL